MKGIQETGRLSGRPHKLALIGKDDSEKFIKNFNRNVVSGTLLDSCQKAGRLFRKA